MKIAMMVDDGKIEMQDIDELSCGNDDILIETKYAGICGSDIHAYKGHHPFRKPPVILGHEVSGKIAKLGRSVSGFSVGDPVTVMPYTSCGDCISCRSGKSNICLKKRVPGTGNWQGTFSEFFISKPQITYRFGKNSRLDIGVLAEPLAVAIHSVRQARFKTGESIAVLGAGPIGLLTGWTAKINGASDIAITDLFDHNLSLAAELFGAATYDAKQEQLSEKIISDHPDKYDIVFLCGNADIMVQQALEIINPGGRVVLTGMFLKPVELSLIDMTLREIELIGTQIYDHQDFQKAISLLKLPEYKFEKLITHVLPLSHAQEAMQMVCDPSQNTTKVLLES
jgi:(R,R)-butanediol dehydrogenase / meso-butanediol dehydrogenase / diacetyl reductase